LARCRPRRSRTTRSRCGASARRDGAIGQASVENLVGCGARGIRVRRSRGTGAARASRIGPAFSWSTANLAPGAYLVHVWVNNQGSGHDTIGTTSVTLTGCTAASLSPSSGTAGAGTTVPFSAGSTCSGTAVYEFWLEYPDGSWHQQTSFTTTSTWSWATAGRARGNYLIHVWANNQGADTSKYETIGQATYSLT